MRRNDCFTLCEIASVPYLLPFGQEIADLRRGIQINSTGIYLWELLKKERSMDELLALCAEHFEAAEEELPLLEKDLKQFLNLLKAYHMISEDDTYHANTDFSPVKYSSENTIFFKETIYYLKMGGLTLKLSCPAEAFPNHFKAFFTSQAAQAHQEITILFHNPETASKGEVILRSEELIVLDMGEQYVLFFPTMEKLCEARLAKDSSEAFFYCTPPNSSEAWEELQESLFHAIRFPFLYLAEKQHMMAIHSASLLYRGRAWLFSGHSGIGKSTHTNLWKALLNTPLINGDLNLLAIENHQPVIHGLPWCGTSEISDTNTYPLGGIILLKQATEDFTEKLSEDQKRLLISQRFISPIWTKEQLTEVLTFADNLAGDILICRLHCTKNNTAVTTIKQVIDTYLKQWSTT